MLGKKDVSVGGVRSSYDMVFPGTATQEDVYEAIKPSVEAVATVRSTGAERQGVLLLIELLACWTAARLDGHDKPGDSHPHSLYSQRIDSLGSSASLSDEG